MPAEKKLTAGKPMSRREAQLLVDRVVAATATQKHLHVAGGPSTAPASMPGVVKKLGFKRLKKKNAGLATTKAKQTVSEQQGKWKETQQHSLKRRAMSVKKKKRSSGGRSSSSSSSSSAKKEPPTGIKKVNANARRKHLTEKLEGAAESEKARMRLVSKKDAVNRKKTSSIAGQEEALVESSKSGVQPQISDAEVIQTALCGQQRKMLEGRSARDMMLVTDLAMSQPPAHSSFVAEDVPSASSGCPFLTTYLEEKIMTSPVADEASLLKDAHEYFLRLNKKERQWNRTAMNRLKDMKRANRQGGDKDGFQYVVPKSVKTVVQQIMVQEGVEGANIDGAQLESAFLGDGIKETEQKPMRRKKVKNYAFDDFYQFQVAKKWTKNAESFLTRGRANRNMFMAKQQTKRTIKKL